MKTNNNFTMNFNAPVGEVKPIQTEREANMVRTSLIVDENKMAKVRMIAVREHLTMSEIVNYALEFAIERYEELYGEEKDIRKIFGK